MLEIELLFNRAKDELFQDGMESQFSQDLLAYIRENGNPGVLAVARLVMSEKADAEVASEALRWLGQVEHDATYYRRRLLLERGLFHPSASVRDGAGLGLAALGDSHAIPYLKEAISREPVEELRRDLGEVVAELEHKV